MTSIIRTTYDKLQETLDEYYEEEHDIIDDEVKIENESLGDDFIVTDGPRIIIEDLGLMAVEGTYFTKYSDEDEYTADFSLTLIYDDPEEEDLNNYQYFEQDPPATAIHNYLASK